MMKKMMVLAQAMIFSILLLTGCGLEGLMVDDTAITAVSNETTAPAVPEGAVYPVMADEEKGIKATTIKLSDFSITIPEGYVYGKVDYETEGYTAYYIWQADGDQEYIHEQDGDVMMYVYEGLDVNSPHVHLESGQVLSCFSSVYMERFRSLVNGVNFSIDPKFTESSDGKYYLNCFTGKSGEYIATTYGTYCYPKTYYGIYALEQTTTTSDRRWYGFVFSNDAKGEIFTENEYTYLLGQIKVNLDVSAFYTPAMPDSAFYNSSEDVSQGRSYEQLVGYYDVETETLVDGLFYDTLLYYVETLGRGYERENIDSVS